MSQSYQPRTSHVAESQRKNTVDRESPIQAITATHRASNFRGERFRPDSLPNAVVIGMLRRKVVRVPGAIDAKVKKNSASGKMVVNAWSVRSLFTLQKRVPPFGGGLFHGSRVDAPKIPKSHSTKRQDYGDHTTEVMHGHSIALLPSRASHTTVLIGNGLQSCRESAKAAKDSSSQPGRLEPQRVADD